MGIGNLSCLDGYMNVAMENTKEIVDGQVKAAFGDAFIRGNNGKSLLFSFEDVELGEQT